MPQRRALLFYTIPLLAPLPPFITERYRKRASAGVKSSRRVRRELDSRSASMLREKRVHFTPIVTSISTSRDTSDVFSHAASYRDAAELTLPELQHWPRGITHTLSPDRRNGNTESSSSEKLRSTSRPFGDPKRAGSINQSRGAALISYFHGDSRAREHCSYSNPFPSIRFYFGAASQD